MIYQLLPLPSAPGRVAYRQWQVTNQSIFWCKPARSRPNVYQGSMGTVTCMMTSWIFLRKVASIGHGIIVYYRYRHHTTFSCHHIIVIFIIYSLLLYNPKWFLIFFISDLHVDVLDLPGESGLHRGDEVVVVVKRTAMIKNR